jgi:hypothetical protein
MTRKQSLLRDLLVAALAVTAVVLAFRQAAHARGDGYSETPANVRNWFQHLMQPDAPEVSCCGEADAYEADDFEVSGDHYVAIVTDTRSDTFSDGHVRPHIAPGTRINIPNTKLKFDAGNPSGHGYVFLGDADQLYCYVTPSGT